MTSSEQDTGRPDSGRMMAAIGMLPTLLTLCNLVCGFAAIGVAAHAQFLWKTVKPTESWEAFALAGWLILLAMVFDALDGKVARMSRSESEFGSQLDSLADIVSFGVAPAYIVFLEASSRNVFGHYWYAFVCSGLYVVCAGLRLARFNVETRPEEPEHFYFRGLPTPAAAGVIAALAIFEWRMKADAAWAARTMPYAAVLLGALMISRFRYAHLLNILLSDRTTFTHLVVLVFGVFTVLALPLHYEYVLLAGFGLYLLSGPVTFVRNIAARKPTDSDTENGRSIF